MSVSAPDQNAYVDPDLVVDEVAQAEAVLSRLADRINGWSPEEGHLETALAEGVGAVTASAVAELRDEARDTLSGFGEGVLGVERTFAQPARGVATFVLTDRIGHTIPDGFELILRTGDGDLIAFATVGDTPVPTDQDTATVEIVALEPGTLANGLAGDPTHWDSLPWLDSVRVTGATSGGEEDESAESYRDKVVRRARRYRAIPVVPEDYAAMALDVPTITRCIAVNRLDLSDPESPDEDAIGHLTLFPIDATGQPVLGSAVAALQRHLASTPRLMGVQLHIGRPNYVRFVVVITVRALADADPEVVTADVKTAIAAAYDPARYGFDANAPGLWIPNREPIRHFDVATIAAKTAGVAGVVSCTAGADTWVPMEGFAPLPDLYGLVVNVAGFEEAEE